MTEKNRDALVRDVRSYELVDCKQQIVDAYLRKWNREAVDRISPEQSGSFGAPSGSTLIPFGSAFI